VAGLQRPGGGNRFFNRLASDEPPMNRRAKLSGDAIPYRDASRFRMALRESAKKTALGPEYMSDEIQNSECNVQNAKCKMRDRPSLKFEFCISHIRAVRALAAR
jgi:hypothetical protein